MQHSWSFHLPESIPHPISKVCLKKFFEDSTKDLGIFLSYYFRKEGAVTENVSIPEEPVFESESSGTVRVQFDLIYFNACLNIHEEEKDQMLLSFSILEEDHLLTVIGPYWPERGMDEI
ncbi:hypothetical protein [Cecembia lonarensis]|uniref:Uncharacterized protein n=1 Tax=Cecembia lonarensis (strain CCUG 58316 / KCTC 22772 / LW9) TaxID=1225176 RepID=K1L392_CECL9|nr:hypothetical protein [Cecembia lonarensis]EKB50880.1 hypothetical protein B879_00408 [Cecembia lonarensis LW9]